MLLRSAVSAWPRRCRSYATVPSAAPRGARELTLVHFNDVGAAGGARCKRCRALGWQGSEAYEA